MLRPRRAAGRHPFDILLDGLRKRYSAAFVENTGKLFRTIGSYGLFAAMAVVAAFAVIETVKTHAPGSIISGVVVVLVLVALQYVAGKFCDALEQLNRTTSSSLSSPAFPDCCALMNLAAGAALLIGSIIMAVQLAMHSSLVPGIAALLVGLLAMLVSGYLAILALNLSALNVSIDPQVRAGEEAIGVVTFSLKTLLRFTPVAFGAGVICGTVLMGYACYQALTTSGAAAAAAGLGGIDIGAAGLAAAGMMIEPGFGMTAGLARTVLLWSAALPFVAYLLFILYCLLIEVCRAFSDPTGKNRQTRRERRARAGRLAAVACVKRTHCTPRCRGGAAHVQNAPCGAHRLVCLPHKSLSHARQAGCGFAVIALHR